MPPQLKNGAPMTSATSYLEQNNLHFKPISARMVRGVLGLSTTVINHASETRWHGKVVWFVGKGTLLAGSALTVPVALIEVLSLTLIGTTALAFNKLLCQNQSLFLQKHSLKALSYALHSATMVVALLVLMTKLPHIRLHTVQALIDYTLYLGTAGLVQCLAGTYLDRLAGRDPDLAITRPLHLLLENYQMAGNDIVHQIQYDFDITLRDELGQNSPLQAHFTRHPEDRELLASFDFRRIFTDQTYRRDVLVRVRSFLLESGWVNRAAEGENLFDLNQNSKMESDYQTHLAKTLKEAFIEIHSNDTLSSYLDQQGGSTGKERLEAVDGGIFMPLATYTQYKEALGPVHCPASFTSSNLHRYNERRKELLSLNTDLAAFTSQQKTDLVRKILQGSDFTVTDQKIQDVYNKIGQLAEALSQGPLMTRVSLDLNALDNGGQIMQSRNLFQNACQEAVAAVTPAEV